MAVRFVEAKPTILERLYHAIHIQESGGKYGDWQVQLDTFRRFAKPGEKIDNPEDQTRVAKRYIDYLYEKAGGDIRKVAVGYFSGEGNMGDKTPWKDNRSDKNGKTVASYVDDISSRMGVGGVEPSGGQAGSGGRVVSASAERAPRETYSDYASGKSRFPGWADRAFNEHRGDDRTTIVRMEPKKYLDLVEPVKGDPSKDAKGARLKTSMDKGEQIHSLPSLDVDKDGNVTDYDGRHRVHFVAQSGEEIVPVAVTRPVGADHPSIIKGRDGNEAPGTPHVRFVAVPETEGQGSANSSVGPSNAPTEASAPKQPDEGLIPGPLGSALRGIGNSFFGHLLNRDIELIKGAGHFLGLDSPTEKEVALEKWKKDFEATNGRPPNNLEIMHSKEYHDRRIEFLSGFAFPGSIAAAGENALSRGATGSMSRAEREVTSRLAEGVRGGGASPSEMKAAAAAAPEKPMTLLDVGGKPVQELGGKVYRTFGEPTQKVGGFLEKRDADAYSRLADDVAQGLSPKTAYRETQKLEQEALDKARPLYEAAGVPSSADRYITAPLVNSEKVNYLLNNSGIIQKAIGSVRKFAAYKDLPNNSMVMLDKAYKSLVEDERHALSLGNKTLARDIQAERESLKEAITGGNPDHPYARALAAYSGPHSIVDAIDFGETKVFGKGGSFGAASNEEIADTVGRMSDSERAAARIGLASRFRASLDPARPAANEASLILRNDRAIERIKPFFDDEQQLNRFVNNVKAEAKMFDTKYNIMGGSQTAHRMAADRVDAEAGWHAAKTASDLASGNFFGAAHGILNLSKVMSKLRDPELYKEMADILTETVSPGSRAYNILDVLEKYGVGDSWVKRYSPKVGAALTRPVYEATVDTERD